MFPSAALIPTARSESPGGGCHTGSSRAFRNSSRFAWQIHFRRRCCINGEMNVRPGCDGILNRGSKRSNASTEERFSRRIQEWLDAGMGACHLRRSDVRGEVERCLLHFDGMRYHVDSFVLMPNPHTYHDRPSTPLRSLNTTQRNQGANANRCNNSLRRKSTF